MPGNVTGREDNATAYVDYHVDVDDDFLEYRNMHSSSRQFILQYSRNSTD
jgi:hypothetical protein